MNINRAQLQALADGVFDSLGEDPSKYDPANTTLEEQIIASAANLLVQMLRQSLIDKDGRASGELLQSLSATDTVKTGDTVRATIVGAPHWRAFEYGQPKGTVVPVKDLEEWITAKGIKIRSNRKQSTQSVLQRRHSLAVAISKKIFARGTIQRFGYNGSNFVRDVLTDQNMQVISDILAEKYGLKLGLFVTTEK